MPSRRLKKIACLNCSPPIPSLLHCSITRVVNHLKEIDRSLDSPRARLLSQSFYLRIKTYNNAGNFFQVYKGVLQTLLTPFLVAKLISFFGTTCCKAITLFSDHCWPKLFPFNPAFPSMLKNVCLTGFRVGWAAPSPLGANQITVNNQKPFIFF